jgi:hypothetical protein
MSKRDRVQLFFTKPSLTQQHFKESTSIDYLMQLYTRSGQSPFRSPEQTGARYGDFSDMPSYQAVLDRVRLAQSEFDSLDAKTRLQYNNSVELYINSLTEQSQKDGGAQRDAPANPEEKLSEGGA